MKKYVIHLLLSITATLILANASYSQTSNPSTPLTTTDRAAIVSLCERAKDEVVAGRVLIKSYEDTLAKAEKEQNLSDTEIVKLRDALDHEKKAVAANELAIVEYKKALAKEVKKKNFYRRIAGGLILTTAALAAIVVLRR